MAYEFETLQVEVKDGPYAGVEGVGPEYESLSCLGPVCDVTDVPTILKANLLCNLYGIDTISFGTICAYVMECFERGILNLARTGGLELRFGNADAQMELLHQMAAGRGFGFVAGATCGVAVLFARELGKTVNPPIAGRAREPRSAVEWRVSPSGRLTVRCHGVDRSIWPPKS